MNVETPFRDFLAFWERAAGRPREEQVALWDELYARPNLRTIAQYERHFAGVATLEDALPRYGEVVELLEPRFAAIELERGGDEVAALLDVDVPFRAVALVGLFTANAWFDDDYAGEPAVFFALEADPPDLWHRTIAIHELVHLAHHLARSGGWEETVPAQSVFMEGLAVAATRRLVPEATGEQHFAVDDYEAWTAECRAAWDDAARKLLDCFERPDADERRRFFWPDWGRDARDVPERFGYYAAAEAFAAAAEGHDLAELARWPPERAAAEVRSALEALTPR
ncbi:MAG TPA: hypothetical protein VF529_05785 [Solirubrobacteraceae bacterium]